MRERAGNGNGRQGGIPVEILSLLSILIIVSSMVVPFRKRVSVCQVIVITNFLLFFLMILGHALEEGRLYPGPSSSMIRDLGYSQDGFFSAPWAIISSLYVHGHPLHIIMNMLFLFLLGFPLEQKLGPHKFFFIYILGGIGGNLISGLFDPAILGIGASGAVFAVMGAFAAKYPYDEVPLYLVIFFLQRVPVWLAVAVYGTIETLYVLTGVQDGVGHLAHMGGLASGVFLVNILPLSVDGAREKYFDSLIFRTIAQETGKEEFIRIGDEIERADEKDIRSAWIDEFFEKVSCPSCGSPGLGMDRKGIGCRDCQYQKLFSEIKIRPEGKDE